MKTLFNNSRYFWSVILKTLVILLMPIDYFLGRTYAEEGLQRSLTGEELGKAYGYVPDITQWKVEPDFPSPFEKLPEPLETQIRECHAVLRDLSDMVREIRRREIIAITYKESTDPKAVCDLLFMNLEKIHTDVFRITFLNFHTAETDQFAVLQNFNSDMIKSAFCLSITENDPVCPERTFQVELHFPDSSGRNLMIDYASEEASFMDSNHLDRSLFIKSVKDPTKSDPDKEVAWEHLLTHLFRVRLEIKKNLAFNSNPDMPPGVDKSPERRQRNNSKLRESSVNSELKTKHIHIAHKPTWMNSFLQSTGTITSHDDPKVQKLREDQSKFSTKFSINTLITCLFFIAVWSMIGGFKSPVTKIASLRRP